MVVAVAIVIVLIIVIVLVLVIVINSIWEVWYSAFRVERASEKLRVV